MRIRWYVEVPQWLIVAAMFALAASAWNLVHVPMPVHWIGDRADGFGGKFQGLLLDPLLAVGVYLLLLFAPQLNDGAIGFSGTTLDSDSPAYRRVIEPLYHLVRTIVLAFLAVTYFAQVRVAEGYPVKLETIDRDGLAVVLVAGAILIVATLALGKPKRYW
jgi:immunity protein, SdpI family